MTEEDPRNPYAPPVEDGSDPAADRGSPGYRYSPGSGTRVEGGGDQQQGGPDRGRSRAWGHGGSGAPPSGPGRPLRAAGPVVRQGRQALALTLVGLVLIFVLPPVGFVLVLAGLVLGVRALRLAGRCGGTAPGAVPAVVVGVLGTLVGIGMLAGMAYLLPELQAYRDCRLGANTEVARSACWTEFEGAYRRKLGER